MFSTSWVIQFLKKYKRVTRTATFASYKSGPWKQRTCSPTNRKHQKSIRKQVSRLFNISQCRQIINTAPSSALHTKDLLINLISAFNFLEANRYTSCVIKWRFIWIYIESKQFQCNISLPVLLFHLPSYRGNSYKRCCMMHFNSYSGNSNTAYCRCDFAGSPPKILWHWAIKGHFQLNKQ